MKQKKQPFQKLQDNVTVSFSPSYELNQRLRSLIAAVTLGREICQELLPEKAKKIFKFDKLEAEIEKLIKTSQEVIKDLNN